MDATSLIVGIDVSKNQLDVHVRGSGESFVVPRDAEGLAALIERLRPLGPRAIGPEATGGFETFAATGQTAWRRLRLANCAKPSQKRAIGRMPHKKLFCSL